MLLSAAGACSSPLYLVIKKLTRSSCSLFVASIVSTRITPACCATGAIDALTLLDKYIAPGCVLLFDDLVNYPNYRDHEILALWEWLQTTGRKLEVRCLTHHAYFGWYPYPEAMFSRVTPCLLVIWYSCMRRLHGDP